jgi:hypothetical protein
LRPTTSDPSDPFFAFSVFASFPILFCLIKKL